MDCSWMKTVKGGGLGGNDELWVCVVRGRCTGSKPGTGQVHVPRNRSKTETTESDQSHSHILA
jgi:hypothetical protein